MKPSFAVVGAGVSGSFAAWTLRKATSASVKVFEMGRGSGGRCSSRKSREMPGFYVDHGCPAFTASSKLLGWKEIVQELEKKKIVEEWKCSAGFLSASGEPSAASCPPLYRGIGGMETMCEKLLEDCDVSFNTVVRNVEREGSKWILYNKNEEELARVDHLVISSLAIACSLRWDRIFGGIAPLVKSAEMLQEPSLIELSKQLDENGDNASPVFSVLMGFKREKADWLADLPFDLSIVQGHQDISKVVKNRCDTANYDTVVVHSTHSFAADATDVFGSQSAVSRLQEKSASTLEKNKVYKLRP